MTRPALLFDLDGTLLDTLDDLVDAVNGALLAMGRPQRTRREIRRFLGNGTARLIELCLPQGTRDPVYAACQAEMKRRYAAGMKRKTRPYPGILPLLDRLKAAGYPLAVISNKFNAAVQGLCADFFPGYFDAVIGEGEGVRRKPYPDGVLAALSLLGRPQKEAWYIGDSEVDFQTAQAAGMDCILVSWGFRDREELSAFGCPVADTIEELELQIAKKGS